MDPIILATDMFSIAVLLIILFLGSRAVRAFRQSKQAVTESASLLSVIVGALTSRVEASESLVNNLQGNFQGIEQRSSHLEREQSSHAANYLQLLRYLQEVLSNDKKLIVELEQLKTKFASIQRTAPAPRSLPTGVGSTLPEPSGNALVSLTPTELQTLDILRREGPKAAPELGRRLRKSREHMARLMKKLYLEGYVDRESNRAPFRYKLNDRVGPILEHGEKPVTAVASEKA